MQITHCLQEKANDEAVPTQSTPKHAFLEKNLDELTRAHNKVHIFCVLKSWSWIKTH